MHGSEGGLTRAWKNQSRSCLPYSLPSGDNVCNLNVATNRRFTTRDGDKRDETTWFRVSVWGRQAESCAQYLTKGRKVLVVGRVSANAFTDRDGKARASLEISATTVQFLSGRDDEEGMSGGSGSYSHAGSYDSTPRDSAPRDSGSRMEDSDGAISRGGTSQTSEAPRASIDDEEDGDIPF